ncbi:MAG: hypothetical protein HOQ22_06665 [Nocardioidaceae bacterium]|nr:hypothetical protein [Nocardioidaceae bacterium]NUS50711.1 hypothetical protein [Nocardioidaceae bacterium]
MTVSASLAAALLVASGPVPSHPLFTWQGDDVIESSGLVDRGALVWTNNDSGDDAVLYAADTRTGNVVRRATYADAVTDVEAIAPGRGRTLWAADIGDNRANRDDIAVYHVHPRADGDAPRFPLRYPDRPHDAETLLVQPGTQRVFVVSKSVFGGTVYAAPRHLQRDRENRLHRFAEVSGLVTDGAFFPDGRHVLLRTYGTASVYTFPGFELVGTVTLPAQPQGEGISVGHGGRVLVSSEGVRSQVLQVTLPAALSRSGSTAPASPEGPPPSTTGPPPTPQSERPPRTTAQWVGIGAVGLVIAGLGWLTLRVARPRGPHRR